MRKIRVATIGLVGGGTIGILLTIAIGVAEAMKGVTTSSLIMRIAFVGIIIPVLGAILGLVASLGLIELFAELEEEPTGESDCEDAP